MSYLLHTKVCGMRDLDNILNVIELNIDYLGFIFAKKSPRFIDLPQEQELAEVFEYMDFGMTKKVGVFVNNSIDYILEKRECLSLDAIQLHGDESVEFCRELNARLKDPLFEVIKAFSVDDSFNFESTTKYEGVCDYFLFDTKGKNHGGNGVQFNWNILEKYKGNTPFFLSGGIGKDDAKAILDFQHPQLFAIDVNSKFEIKPALKDVERLDFFTTELNRD